LQYFLYALIKQIVKRNAPVAKLQASQLPSPTLDRDLTSKKNLFQGVSPVKHSRKSVFTLFTFSRRFIFALACTLSTFWLTPQPLQAQAFDRIERERALTMLGVLKNELKKNYYDPTFRGMDVDARFKLAEEKIKQATSLGQAFGSIAQAMLDLDDSHTFFSPPARPLIVEYGWEMQAIGDQCYVSPLNRAATPLKFSNRAIWCSPSMASNRRAKTSGRWSIITKP
jgi:hypothetical protein